ncbi:O-antigen ligase family protein [uncultured Aureimonas sp.]|uniref:O-antigen ligase family protein n=1 Tax=uncultured Aureimonas sp. TaxID=1604662 RepID=UPI0025FA7784|nr:O-antigen ligase family protein [uncultured Aureimonas sp.]
MTATGFEGVRLEIKIEEPSGRRRPDAAITLDGAQRRTPRPTLLGRALLIAALAVCIGSRGAVSYSALLVTLVLAGAALFVGALSPPAEARIRRSLHAALLMAVALVAYVLFQSWSFEGNPFANPLWSAVDRLVGPIGGAVSVDPAATRDAVFLLILPFVLYGAGLSLYQTDEGALKLLTWLGAFGLAFAVFGIAQVAFFPDSLLLTAKTAYLDSLTGVFVNRNTAGSLLGVASLILATLAVLALPRDRRGRFSIWSLISDPGLPSERSRRVMAWLLAAFVVLLALFLTKSRGALVSTSIAFVAVLPFLWLDGSRASGGPAGARPLTLRRVLLAYGVVALVVLVVGGLFGGLTIQRMATRGIDDVRLCLYWSALDAFGQNWRFGTGFATFASVFPIYRPPDCGAPWDVFLRAHNIYLEGLVGLGIVFVPVLFLGCLHIVANLLRGLRDRRRMRVVPLMALGAMVLVGLHGLVDFSLQIPGMAAYFATYLAAATTISLGRRADAPLGRSSRGGQAG